MRVKAVATAVAATAGVATVAVATAAEVTEEAALEAEWMAVAVAVSGKASIVVVAIEAPRLQMWMRTEKAKPPVCAV